MQSAKVYTHGPCSIYAQWFVKAPDPQQKEDHEEKEQKPLTVFKVLGTQKMACISAWFAINLTASGPTRNQQSQKLMEFNRLRKP